MALVPPVLPADVEEMANLTPALFDLASQGLLDTLVQKCIDRADAWMQGHMGGNYGLVQFAWQPVLQREGQIYLALEKLTDLLKAKKTVGSHVNYISEDTPAYQTLIENDWGQRAMSALDLWVTVEQMNRNFALPLFSTSSPIPETDTDDQSLDPLSLFYSGLLDRARGLMNPDLGTVTR